MAPASLPVLVAAFSLLFAAATPIRDVADACSSQVQDFEHLNSTAMHLPLHHSRGPCSPVSVPSDLPFSAVLTHDDARIASLAARLAKAPSSSTARPTVTVASLYRANDKVDGVAASLASVPLTPGTSYGVGNYVTRMGLGTPAKPYIMVVDTGSSLTWLQCSPCRVSCHRQSGPVFDPKTSSSYAAVSCSTPQCNDLSTATLNPAACSSSDVCIYQASYGDSSFSVGYLSKDTVSFGSNSVPNFYYGCGQDNEGLFGRSAGLMGLARNKLSLLYQLAPTLGYSFSYCLPSSSSSGYLSIGSYNPGQYSYTPMVSSTLDDSLYFITRLPTTVYDSLSKAVAGAMKGTKRADAYSILDTCFVGQASSLRVPAVSMGFSGGAALKLSAQNLLVDVDSSTTCLAFAPARSAAIIGNTQQQTFSVVYDVKSNRIGFAAGGCR
ncbi:unnamed protein product [Triticum turgidum subsp. durum]|uniref:Peptidase A1 domain-containing protein n=1 Tax=Triticum turgidum subsp. durum TaxID=4567 RepID=A0A9R0YRB6_TRITD|nr:unnamed protein product [Triticum turgidum subsp. durum]